METMARHSNKGVTAWIITWEWNGDYAHMDNPFVLALDRRLGGENIRKIVEHLYAAFIYDDTDKVGLVLPDASNPYPATFLTINGMRWQGEIHCGHNPWLRARIVENLKVIHEKGVEKVTWTERQARKNGGCSKETSLTSKFHLTYIAASSGCHKAFGTIWGLVNIHFNKQETAIMNDEYTRFIGWCLFALLFLLVPFWKTYSKAGLKPGLSLLIFLPFGFLIALLILAFAPWPAISSKEQ